MSTSTLLLPSEKTQVVHVRQDHDVYIGRAMPGRTASEWRNPFRIGIDCTREQALNRFREHLTELLARDPEVAKRLQLLKGKRLGCWCKPAACHGDILAELLDGPAPAAAPPPQLDLF